MEYDTAFSWPWRPSFHSWKKEEILCFKGEVLSIVMGSIIEFNDTLQITTEQGFPDELQLEKHLKTPFTAKDFGGRVFEFHDKPGMRLYHPAPTRAFLVHNINGKWLYWGHVQIVEQTINSRTKTTAGKFVITEIYSAKQQREMSIQEVDAGKEYFT
ncbi:MAG: hypothetical protein HY420_05200 [Candidatus Kerfeldbacteria bacterium]|nr:hypothetical protein [Candidatus Kerfeldbacteria bacterium]